MNKEIEEFFKEHFCINNAHLSEIVRIYLIYTAHLLEPYIGYYTFFKDILHSFKFSIREYCINRHTIQPWEKVSTIKLIKKLSIPISDLRVMVNQINKLLKSYTDENLSSEEQRRILYNQLNEFADYTEFEDKWEYQLYEQLNNTEDDIFHTKRNHFLNQVLLAMKDGEINQIQNNKYLVIDQIIDTYKNIKTDNYLSYNEKRKYLKKLKSTEKIEKALNKYIKGFFVDYEIEYDIIKRSIPTTEEDIENEANNMIEEIRQFLFYLVYDSHKLHIYLIHSILGYKYKGAQKLYQKLFLKDKSTGKIDFLLHTNCSGVLINDLYEGSLTIENFAHLIQQNN